MSHAFYGTIVHSLSKDDPYLILANTVIIVKDGVITAVESGTSTERAQLLAADADLSLRTLSKYSFLMPGLVDTHIHASQYSNAGNGYSHQLLDWLEKYTFPTEAKFKDEKFAKLVYDKVVRRTLLNGTTTACYYATIDVKASIILADTMKRRGQRGFVGKVSMDKSSPDYYIETTEQALSDCRAFLDEMKAIHGTDGLIQACVTPRFALSCTNELMVGLAKLAEEYNAPIQTHMSENLGEVSAVKEECDVDEYIHVYEQCGLLTDQTILAHCVHSSSEELAVIKRYNSGVAHCPNSNMSLRSGMMDIRRANSAGVKLGLGTDVSGGHSVSILDALRRSIDNSKLMQCAMHGPDYEHIEHAEGFYLATLGGAQVMGMEEKIGNFIVGKEFDALVITFDGEGPIDIFEVDSPSDIVEKLLYCGDDRNIAEVYVSGQKANTAL